MAQKLRKHGKKLEKTSVGCHIDFTILLSMLKVSSMVNPFILDDMQRRYALKMTDAFGHIKFKITAMTSPSIKAYLIKLA